MKLTNSNDIRHTVAALLMGCLVFLSACVGPANPESEADPQITPTIILPTETATIIWFPATSTPTQTPIPLPTSTAIAMEGLGGQIGSDPFEDPAAWTNLSIASDDRPNRTLLADGSIVFAINQAPAQLATLNQEYLLTDSAINVTANINRCAPQDTFGILFKAQGEKLGNRISINCNGQFRLEQLRANMTIPLTDWLTSGDVPIGGPATISIGIWTAGNETRIFLNNHYQTSIFDKFYTNGGVGFFANSNGDLGMNVQFADLLIQQVAFQSPTPAPSQRPGSNPAFTVTPAP